jgi:3-deoxy-D-manno-octulosonate 8-phosphate phosphatase (KDO 8-P phosphatase)
VSVQLARGHAADVLASLSEQVRDALSRVDVVAMDVDGVVTDGTRIQGPEGLQGLSVHVRDGLGMDLLVRSGVRVVWVSAVGGSIVAMRAQELDISELHMQVVDKGPVVSRLRQAGNVVMFMGDDLWDLPAFEAADLSVAVSDAHLSAMERADLITSYPGGRGAVREICDLVLAAKGLSPIELMPFN